MHVRALVSASFLFLMGCPPATGVLVDGDPNIDPDTSVDGDPGTGNDPDTSDDPGTDAPDPDTEPSVDTWRGTRDFFFDAGQAGTCEDQLIESGTEVSDDARFNDAVAACPECDLVYSVSMNKERLCQTDQFQGFPVAVDVVRGLEFDGGDVIIYSIFQRQNGQWDASELAEGDASGETRFAYDYEGNVSGIPFEVDGSITLQ